MIRSPNVTLDDVLNDPSVVYAARSESREIIDYLKKHSHELLVKVLSEEQSIASAHALQIFQACVKSVLTEVISDTRFRDLAIEKIVDPNASECLIGRIATLTLVFLTVMPEQAKASCGYIYYLLNFCYNPSVYNFFESICSTNKKMESMQQWLIEIGFVDDICRELQRIDFTYVSKEKVLMQDRVYFKTLCLYKLVMEAAQNPILAASFQTKPIAEAVIKEFADPPEFILSYQWAAISVVCSPGNAEVMQNIIPKAITIITEQFTRMTQYRVCALDFLSSMLENWPKTSEILYGTPLLQILGSLITLFPNSTIFHASFRRFVEVCLNNEMFSTRVVVLYTPMFISIASARENRALSATCFDVITTFINYGKNNKEIKSILEDNPEWDGFVKNEYKNYYNIINTNYGGIKPLNVFNVFKTLLK